MDGFVDFGKNLLEDLFGFSSFNLWDGVIEKILDWVNTATGTVQETVINPLGITFLVLWFFVDLIDTMTLQDFNYDKLFKKFLFLAMGILFINNIEVITTNIPKACLALSKEIKTITTSSTLNTSDSTMDSIIYVWETCADVEPSMFDVGWIGAALLSMGVLVIVMIAWLVAQIFGVVLFVVKAGAMLEMSVRGIMAPIGCADVSKGFNGNSMRYLRKYIRRFNSKTRR